MITFTGIWLALSMTCGAVGATLSRRGGSWIMCALIITAWVMVGGMAAFGMIWWDRVGSAQWSG